MKTIAKYPLIAMTILFLAFAGCNQLATEAEIAYKEQEKASREKALNDSLQMVFAQTLNEIDHNLDLIREKEGTLILGPGSAAETGISTKERIQRNISFINTMMEQNKQKLSSLQAQLKQSKADNKLLTKLTEGAKQRIEKQEEEIAQLKSQLADRSFEVAQLNMKMNELQLANAMLQDKSEKLDKNARLAYYAVGSYKELEKESVMTKQGGILGVGKKKVLKDDFKKEYFSEIDMRENKAIPVFAKKAKLVTFHPKNSFEIERENNTVTWLRIKDPDEFWKMSRYLVVEVQI